MTASYTPQRSERARKAAAPAGDDVANNGEEPGNGKTAAAEMHIQSIGGVWKAGKVEIQMRTKRRLSWMLSLPHANSSRKPTTDRIRREATSRKPRRGTGCDQEEERWPRRRIRIAKSKKSHTVRQRERSGKPKSKKRKNDDQKIFKADGGASTKKKLESIRNRVATNIMRSGQHGPSAETAWG